MYSYVYNFTYAKEILQLKDLDANLIFNDVIMDFNSVKTESDLETVIGNFKLVLYHHNLSSETVTCAFYDLLFGNKVYKPCWYHCCCISDKILSFKIFLMIYEKFGDEIRSDVHKYDSIFYLVQYFRKEIHIKKPNDSILIDRLIFTIDENLFCYDQLIRCFRDLINIFLLPNRIEYLLSIVKDDDLEFCVLISLDEVMKRIEKEKINDISDYFFLFGYKNVNYNKSNIINRIVLMSNTKNSVIISMKTEIDPNYVEVTKCKVLLSISQS